MYKVLLVDDEAVMRLAFHKIIDWEAAGFQLVAAVNNGAEALAYINENPVDILITDLIMPVMDGLELIQTLKTKNFRGVILVLSNYTDFELVRTALTSGAADYMLKLNIDGALLEQQLRMAVSLLKSNGVRAAQESAAFPGTCYPCLLSVRCRDEGSLSTPAERALGLLEQMLARATITMMSENEVHLLIPGDPADKERRIADKLGLVIRQIQTNLNLQANALFSPLVATREQAEQQYAACQQAQSVFFYPSQPAVVSAGSVTFVPLPKKYSPAQTADRYISLYYGKDPQKAADDWSDLMEHFALLPVHPLEAKEFFMAAAWRIAFAISDSTEAPSDLANQPDADVFLEKLHAWLSPHLDSARLSQFGQYGNYQKGVRDAVLFIHFHFVEKITLDDIARAVNLSKNYLCRLFKQETGMQIFSYINDLRMHKAAALIEAGDTYMRGVSAAVGIDDQLYFARVFKKKFGVSPSEYGKTVKNK